MQGHASSLLEVSLAHSLDGGGDGIMFSEVTKEENIATVLYCKHQNADCIAKKTQFLFTREVVVIIPVDQ